MPQNPIVPVPLDRENVVFLLEDCIRKKGLKKKDLLPILGYKQAQSISNFLQGVPQKDENGKVIGVKPMSMTILGRWCKALEYPIEDLLRKRPYAAPGSIAAVDNDLQRAKDRISELEGMVKALKEKVDLLVSDDR